GALGDVLDRCLAEAVLEGELEGSEREVACGRDLLALAQARLGHRARVRLSLLRAQSCTMGNEWLARPRSGAGARCERSVPVVLGLERSRDVDAEVLGLHLGELREPHTEGGEVQ